MPRKILPVNPEELLFALQIGNAAGMQQMPMENVENRGLSFLDKETGEINEIRLRDNPHNRFGSAIAHEYGNDESKFYSIMMRIRSLMILLSSDERVKPYLKAHPDNSEIDMINNVLVEAIADFPISDEGEMDEEAFFIRVQEILKADKRI
jgi:hypothetical protein